MKQVCFADVGSRLIFFRWTVFHGWGGLSGLGGGLDGLDGGLSGLGHDFYL